MKANCGKGNNPTRDEWITPDWIYKPLAKQYHLSLDCCARANNAKCGYPDDFLKTTNMKSVKCWMNPPFSIAWLMFEHFFKVVNKGVAIYRCDNFETGIWQKLIFPNSNWVLIPDRRVNFEGLDGDGARFPSALIGVGVDTPIGISGTIIKVERREP